MHGLKSEKENSVSHPNMNKKSYFHIPAKWNDGMLVFKRILSIFHYSSCDLPACALQWQAGRSDLIYSDFMTIFSDKDKVPVKLAGTAEFLLKHIFAKWMDGI